MLLYIQNINNRKISVFTELKSNQNEDYFNYGYILTEELNNIDLQVGDIISGIKLSEQKIQEHKNKFKIKITNKLRKLKKTERKQLISENKYEYVLFHLGKNKLFSSQRKANNKRKSQLLYEAKRCFDICEQDFPSLNYIYFYRSIINFNLEYYSDAYADLTNKKYPTVKKEENDYYKFLGISAFHHNRHDESILYLSKYKAYRGSNNYITILDEDQLKAKSNKYLLLGKSHYYINKENSEYYVKKNFEESIKYSLELYNRHDNTYWDDEREAKWRTEALDSFTFNLRKNTYGWVADYYYQDENYEKALEYYEFCILGPIEIDKDNNIMISKMKGCYFKMSNYFQMLEIILKQIESFSFDSMDEEDGHGFCGKLDYVSYRNDNIVELWYQAAFCEYKAKNYIKSFYYLKIAISICENKEWEIGEKYSIHYDEGAEGYYLGKLVDETWMYVGSLKETIHEYTVKDFYRFVSQNNYFSEEEYKEMTPEERGGIIQAKQLDRLSRQLFWWQNRIEQKVGHKITDKEMADVIYIDFEEMYERYLYLRQFKRFQTAKYDLFKLEEEDKLIELLDKVIKLDGLHYQAYYCKAKLIYQYYFDEPKYWYEEDSGYPFDCDRGIAFECIAKCLTIKPDFVEGYELRINIRKETKELKGNTIDRKIISMLKKLKKDKERKK